MRRITASGTDTGESDTFCPRAGCLDEVAVISAASAKTMLIRGPVNRETRVHLLSIDVRPAGRNRRRSLEAFMGAQVAQVRDADNKPAKWIVERWRVSRS